MREQKLDDEKNIGAQEVKICRVERQCRPPELATTRTSKRSLLASMPLRPRRHDTQFERHNAWTEDMLDGLAPHEHDFQEFKGPMADADAE